MRVLLLTMLLAVPALAGDVFINGVQVEGLANQQFDKVTVKFDERGNIWIEAPGYNVKRVSPAPPSNAATAREDAVISKRYFLVSEQNVAGMTEYNIDVFVNSKFIRTVRSSEEQIVSDITKHLKPGKNNVMFAAKKACADKDTPKSLSRTHFLRVIIGEGVMSADQVVIENPVVKFERTAADQNDVVQEFTLTTH